jgi:hypothetical protein
MLAFVDVHVGDFGSDFARFLIFVGGGLQKNVARFPFWPVVVVG